jgi:hypothetical protein
MNITNRDQLNALVERIQGLIECHDYRVEQEVEKLFIEAGRVPEEITTGLFKASRNEKRLAKAKAFRLKYKTAKDFQQACFSIVADARRNGLPSYLCNDIVATRKNTLRDVIARLMLISDITCYDDPLTGVTVSDAELTAIGRFEEWADQHEGYRGYEFEDSGFED